jgi:hypothetical protein
LKFISLPEKKSVWLSNYPVGRSPTLGCSSGPQEHCSQVVSWPFTVTFLQRVTGAGKGSLRKKREAIGVWCGRVTINLHFTEKAEPQDVLGIVPKPPAFLLLDHFHLSYPHRWPHSG